MYEVREASNDVPNVVKIGHLSQHAKKHVACTQSMVSQLSFLEKGKLAQEF
jgi:hypothetical protein